MQSTMSGKTPLFYIPSTAQITHEFPETMRVLAINTLANAWFVSKRFVQDWHAYQGSLWHPFKC